MHTPYRDRLTLAATVTQNVIRTDHSLTDTERETVTD